MTWQEDAERLALTNAELVMDLHKLNEERQLFLDQIVALQEQDVQPRP